MWIWLNFYLRPTPCNSSLTLNYYTLTKPGTSLTPKERIIDIEAGHTTRTIEKARQEDQTNRVRHDSYHWNITTGNELIRYESTCQKLRSQSWRPRSRRKTQKLLQPCRAQQAVPKSSWFQCMQTQQNRSMSRNPRWEFSQNNAAFLLKMAPSYKTNSRMRIPAHGTEFFFPFLAVVEISCWSESGPGIASNAAPRVLASPPDLERRRTRKSTGKPGHIRGRQHRKQVGRAMNAHIQPHIK